MTQFVSSPMHIYKPVPRPDTAAMPLLKIDQLPKTTLMRTLATACSLRRDHGSATEARFVGWLCNRLPVSMIDGAGNVHVDLRGAPHHRTLFTSHTDSVHHGGGGNYVHVDGDTWRAGAGHALGADDAAGMALMCHMIEHKIPGLYIFFRGEECGGVGSDWLAKNMPELLKGIDRAVAFDRGGFYDVITHQSGGRCCSDAFATELANSLSTTTDWFMPSSEGVFTDTANLMELVPECTNISVGYQHQHGDREEQDVEFLVRLSEAVLDVAWDELPVHRDPKMMENIYEMSDWPYTVQTRALDDPETIAIDAIERAIDGDLSDLIACIAATVYPQNPTLAISSINRKKLAKDALLEGAFESLMDGWPVDQVLNDLYDSVALP